YLAHLFAGIQLRRQSQWSEAREELTRALEAWPEGQIAALSLAEILHTLGERGEAAATLGGAIEDQGDPKRPDPARVYYLGDRAEQKQLLEAVKATVSGLPESQ